MAGSLAIVVDENGDNLIPGVNDQWQVHFARFFLCPSLSTTCPSLLPLPQNCKFRPTRGTWIATTSSTASLQITKDQSAGSDEILTVCMKGKVLEEHYVSKLNFAWPHVSCVSGFAARGIRSVLVSYKDSANEIQKFALRFSTSDEAQIFINALKHNLTGEMEVEPQKSDFGSGISSNSDFNSSDRLPSITCEDSSTLSPVQAYTPQVPLSLNYRVEKLSCGEETIHNHKNEGISTSFPPSFTSLMANCFSDPKQGQAQTSVNEDINFKSQIARYMEDSSFQDMLMKVEKVIDEIGGNMLL